MGRAEALIALRRALSVDPELELLEEPGELQRHSRDAFEYSPVLTPVSYTHLTLPTNLSV